MVVEEEEAFQVVIPLHVLPEVVVQEVEAPVVLVEEEGVLVDMVQVAAEQVDLVLVHHQLDNEVGMAFLV
jgi:hypothetical protein